MEGIWAAVRDVGEVHARLADAAAKEHVRLGFEPEPGMFIDTMAAFAGLYDRVAHPFFGLTFDVGHVRCQGENIVNEIRRWTDCLFNVHIEDMRPGVHEQLRGRVPGAVRRWHRAVRGAPDLHARRPPGREGVRR